MRPLYWALIVFLGALWGCSFLFNAVLVREIGPLWVSGLRTAIGAVGCWAFFIATRRVLPRDPKLYAQLVVLGLLNYAIPFALFPLAAKDIASGIVGVINGMTPMTTVIVSQLWPGGEKASWNKGIGVAIGFVGAVVLASPSFGAGGTAQLWAIGACLLATLCYALTLNYARRFAKVDSATVAASSLTAAALMTIPVAFMFEGMPVITRGGPGPRCSPSDSSPRASPSCCSTGCCRASAPPTCRSTSTSRPSRRSCWRDRAASASNWCTSPASRSSSSAPSSWTAGWSSACRPPRIRSPEITGGQAGTFPLRSFWRRFPALVRRRLRRE